MYWRSNSEGRVADDFKTPIANYQVTAAATSASTTIPRTTYDERLVRLTAKGADIRWNIDSAATATTHFLPQNTSVNIKLGWLNVSDDDHTIHAIRDASTSGTLEITSFREWS